MPKSQSIHYPLSGLFAINKPSGPTSMSILDSLKPLFSSSQLFKPYEGAPPPTSNTKKVKGSKWRKNKGGNGRSNGGYSVKVGQGGTLDPLADGVLVVGLNRGTKKLTELLDCSKEYVVIGLLGCETDSYDSQGSIVSKSNWKHVTRERIEENLNKFRGEIEQLPPIFSAIRIEGKRLFEYARAGEVPPRPVDKRKCTIQSITLEEFIQGDKHNFDYPQNELNEDDKNAAQKAQEFAGQSSVNEINNDDVTKINEDNQNHDVNESTGNRNINERPSAFKLRMTVSGGTYVRSIVHDLGKELGSSAHVVSLTRTRQGEFALPNTSIENGGLSGSEGQNIIDWSIFEKAINEKNEQGYDIYDESNFKDWEQKLINVIKTD